jgi:hypothetical protein
MHAALLGPRQSPWRLFAAAVLLPTVFVAIDRLLLDCIAGLRRTDWIMLLTMSVFVVQAGVMGIVCARWIEQPIWRWIIYGWFLLLIDFQTLIAWAFTDDGWWNGSFWPASLFAAQFGLIAIWAILGSARWTIRVPVAVLAGSSLSFLLIRFRYEGDNATALFIVQLVVLAGILLTMRAQGFRLAPSRPRTSQVDSTPVWDELQVSQFGLRDVLIWMTALAVICGLLRVIGLPFEQWSETRYRPWLPEVINGAAVGVALMLGLWAALGNSRPGARWALMIVPIPAMAMAAGVIQWLFLTSWLFLAAGTLFAALLFLRERGYRLTRHQSRPNRTGPLTPNLKQPAFVGEENLAGVEVL